MRAFHDIAHPTPLDRLAERRAGIDYSEKPRHKPICWFDGRKLLTGFDTLHRIRSARLWRTRMRIKRLIAGKR